MSILGHTVVRTAASGAEALAAIEAGLEVDLVILDQNMPGLSGLETLEHLRSPRPDLPVVLCTGHLDEGARERLRLTPHVRTLMKPYSIKDIRPLLAEVARGQV
jgi:CheY-like chemotaxis protein